MNDRRKTTVSRHGPRWRVITALLALALCLAPLVAPAQQQDANRLPAGQLPTEADILRDPDLEGAPIDISFVDVDIRDVVRFFSQITGINLVLDPGVAGPSTGIGEGVAIPHGKISGLDRIVASFARSVKGVDFESIDGQPTHLFFLLVVPEHSGGQHLKALARISRFFRDDDFRQKLIGASTLNDVFRTIEEEDRKF